MAHHNLFFAKDLYRNLKDIFNSSNVPDDPSFYVHVPTVTDTGLAPEGKEILYILIPVPNLEKGVFDYCFYGKKLREIVFSRIRSVTGVDLEKEIESEHYFYHQDFISR